MKILILEKSSTNAERIKNGLFDAKLFFSLEVGVNWDQAIKLLESKDFNSIICNDNFADKSWRDLLDFIRKDFPTTNLIFIVEKDYDKSLEILKAGADDILYLQDLERYSFILKKEIHSQKEAERKSLLLTQLENSFREIQFQKFSLDQAAIVTISDKNGNISYVNDKFCKISGYKREEVSGKSHRILDDNSHDTEFWDNFYGTISNGKVWNGEIKNKKKDGSFYWVDMTLVPFIDASNKAYKYVAIQFDITNRILAEEQLTRDAFYDPLTELPNRALFLTKIEQQIYARNINRNLKIAIVVINLDRFKRINNSMGFYAGDLLINRLKEIFINLNTNILISTSRLGGDSFGFLLCSQDLDTNLVQQFIYNIKTILERPIQILDKEIFVTFSSGVAFLGEGGSDGEELAKNAEIAMFQSKETSKSELVFFKTSMLEEIQKKMVTYNHLKRDINDDRILTYFQPIVNLRTMELLGWEALVRWNHPERGILSPYFFLEEAEESGLINKISEIVTNQSFDFYKTWVTANSENPDFFLSLNLSSSQFQNQNIAEVFEIMAKSYNIPNNRIHLEITETVAMIHSQETIQHLNNLRQKDFHISMDDFGTGYSSLAYLKEFPMNTIKIDKSFVDNIQKQERDLALMDTILILASSLDLTVIAEGIESEDQFELLRTRNCYAGQGYYFSRPLSREKALEFMKENLSSDKKIIVSIKESIPS